VNAVTVLPAASCAVTFAENAVPAVAEAGAVTMNRASTPEATLTGVAALVEDQDCQIAVTV
jgi:hypothetical protein